MTADIETIGWTENKKFFEIKLNIPASGFLEEKVHNLARIYIYHYSGECSGCQFVTKFVLLHENKAFVHPCVFDPSDSVDEDFIAIQMTEYLQLKNQ